MADPTVDDVNKQAALAKARKELADAEKARLDAEKARLDSEKAVLAGQGELVKAKAELANAAEKARLDAEKATLDSRKALSEARKAADLSAVQAAIGTVTASAIEGTTTLKPDAGKGEATLLAARAIATAGARIAEAVRGRIDGKRVFLLQGSDVLQFASYRQFLVQQALLERAFDAAGAEASRLAAEADGLAAPAAAPEATVAAATVAAAPAPLLTTAGVAIDAIAKLGSYFMSNYDAGGIALTPDGEQLLSAVAEMLLAGPEPTTAYLMLSGRRAPRPGDFDATIKTLADAVAGAQTALVRLEGRARDTATANPAASKLYEQAAGMLRTALTKAQEFVAGLGAADAKGIVLMTKIVQEKIVCDALASDDARALVLDVRAALGGYYTKKNLWTFLGAMPFFTMGGAVVTYGLIDREGRLEASGLLPVHSGYLRVNAVASAAG